MRKDLLKLYREVNSVLAEWNPIGVDADIALDEYKGYTPAILNALDDQNKLIQCLENILIHKMELEYDTSNKNHVEDLRKVSERLLMIYHNR